MCSLLMFSMHWFLFSIQRIVLHCVLHCEMKQLVLHQDLMHQFIFHAVFTSIPFSSLSVSVSSSLPQAEISTCKFSTNSLPFSGEPYGSLSDLYEYDYGEGASENEIGVGKSTPQFLTQPQQLVSHTYTI